MHLYIGLAIAILLPSFSEGWGRNNGANNALPTYLQQSQVPVVAHSTCTRTNGNFVHESSMVCAGARGSSACNGDSGGPLVCQEGGRWVLRGAASWVTSKQCLTSKYSVYARISSFINWINSKTAGGGGGGGGGSCVDNNRNCRYWTSYCSWHSYVRENCKKTCNLC